MMDLLPQLFASKAKIKILRTLYAVAAPMSLRQIASLANLPVYSVQYGVRQLCQEKFLSKKNKKNRTLYTLNSEHSYFQILAQLFNMDSRLRLQQRTLTYTKKTNQVLNFITAAESVFKTIRRHTS